MSDFKKVCKGAKDKLSVQKRFDDFLNRLTKKLLHISWNVYHQYENLKDETDFFNACLIELEKEDNKKLSKELTKNEYC